MEEWELRWQITSTPIEMFSMHTEHLANVSKSVTKKCYISQNWGTPLFDNTAAACLRHLLQFWGSHFLYLGDSPSGMPVPIIPWSYHCPSWMKLIKILMLLIRNILN